MSVESLSPAVELPTDSLGVVIGCPVPLSTSIEYRKTDPDQAIVDTFPTVTRSMETHVCTVYCHHQSQIQYIWIEIYLIDTLP